MLEIIKQNIASFFGRKSGDSNVSISKRQKIIFKMIVLILMIAIFAVVILIQEKGREAEENEVEEKSKLTKLELPDEGIDTELRWREHFEEKIENQTKSVNEKLAEISRQQDGFVNKTENTIEGELQETKEKLDLARRELASAALELKRIAKEEEDRVNASSNYREKKISRQQASKSVEYDQPKSAENYIPEGTYFTGHLLGGIVVSTALNTADENATPIVIRLTGRGNLNHLNKLDISKCRIMGSSYGDLSSERAIIRLEKMICERDGLYQSSRIAGQLFGPDGFNGIKGTVVSTGSKHIKNAVIGGLISGLSSNAKGREGLNITSGGALSTKSKGMGSMLQQGALQGASNAGEKLADYYLRQAESMSPVLTIPSGVRVNAQITRGFFVGEVNTHKKIKRDKQ